MEKEIWKTIPNYEKYEVSNLGNVKSFHKKEPYIMKKTLHCHGYYVVNIYNENSKKVVHVHKLVAIVFLNHKPDKFEIVINHINHIKTDNRLINLELISNRENCNQKHLKTNTTSKYTGVVWHKQQKKWMSYIKYKRKGIHLGYFICEKKASEAYELALNRINNNLHPKLLEI